MVERGKSGGVVRREAHVPRLAEYQLSCKTSSTRSPGHKRPQRQ